MSVLNTRQQARYRRASINSMILGSLFVGCLATLFASIDLSSQNSNFEERSTAAQEAVSRQRIDLSQNWTYAPDTAHRAPGSLPSAPEDGWKAFDPKISWRFSDEIRGAAWFKTTFDAPYGFQSPALVLGQIPGSHQVYLNGHLIGGSDQGEALAFYPFDWNYINQTGSNTLLVSSHSNPSLNPGISKLTRLGMFIGDIQDVRQSSMAAQTRLYVTQGILLALSVSFFFVTLGFAIFRKAYRQYFYAALVLLLSSLHLAQLNPWIASKLDLQHLRLLQAIALTLAPFTLYSACLHLQRRYLAESINNGAALLTLAGISGWILKTPPASSAELTQVFHYLLIGSMIYALSWISITSAEALIPQRAQARLRESQSTLFEAVFIFFGAASAISSFTNGDGSTWAHAWSETWARALPFAFSFFIVAAASLERNLNRKAALIRASKDELVTGLIRFIHDSPNVSETVIALQARVAMFLKARRSTLYLLDSNESGQAALKATYIHGDEKMREKVSRVIRPDDGIIGHVCETRTPLLIDNVRQDPRFAAMFAKKSEQDPESLYQTGACMIIPLMYGDTLLGVLTFADKKDRASFTQDDFAIAVEVSNDLAVLLDSRRLQETLSTLPAADLRRGLP